MESLEPRLALAADSIVINEIMYRPASDNDLEEYIELYNPGTAAVDLSGYKLTAGVDYTFGARQLGAGAYLVVAADLATFQAKYPAVTNVVGPWSGRLSNSGEAITLRDAANGVVDRVEYADEGDWGVRERGVLDHGHQGWTWTSLANGGGRSLELRSAAMPNEFGQNWSASTVAQGTPGAANSVQAANIAPLVLDVAHSPIIPRSSDEVTVTARVVDELATGITVSLRWRVDGQANFTTTAMFDDGAHGDGQAGDGVYGAKLPAQANQAVVEFYVSATDAASNLRTWPAVVAGLGQVANALYQVDNSYDPAFRWIPGSESIYRLVMTEAERAELAQIGSSASQADSDAQMNGTFIAQDGTGIQVRYNVGIRNRGNGSRDNPPNNYRVNFASDRKWESRAAIDFNSKYTYLQAAGAAVFALAGLPTASAAPVQVMVNGQNLAEPGTRMYGSYVELEVYNSDWAAAHFPADASGNAYKVQDEGHDADLSYLGTNPQSYLAAGYSKHTNVAQNDWSDLIQLTNVLTNAPAATFVAQVEQIVNVDQWLRWFGVHTLLGNQETNLSNGDGDDYSLYRGVNDPRFILLPHDLDTIFGLGDSSPNVNESIFLAATQVPIGRILNHPAFAGRYYAILRELIDTTFSPAQINPLIDQVVGAFLPVAVRDSMKQFIAARSAAVLAQIPAGFTINSVLPLANGYPKTTTDVAALNGTSDPVVTRSVLVAGEHANWDPKTGTWSIGTTSGGGSGPQTLVATGAVWKYLGDGTNQGSAWRDPLFIDAGWPAGPAQLGYGDGDEATTVGFIDTVPGGTVQKNLTTYFRRAFTVLDPSPFTDLTLRVLRDDGVSVFLNGVEVVRDNLPGALGDSAITFTTPATSTVGGSSESAYFSFTVPASRLVSGLNVLAVEIHQDSASSSDISFDLELIGNTAGGGDALTGVPLHPGLNRLLVQTFSAPGGAGELLQEGYKDIWYDDGGMSTLSGTLATSMTLSAAAGPWRVTGDVTVPAGVMLTIEPGATLFFDAATGITVSGSGRLVAEGTEHERIRLTRFPGVSGKWDGLRFSSSDSDNRLAYVDHDFGDNQGDSIQVSSSRLTIDNAWWGGTTITVLEMTNPKVVVRNSVLPSIVNNETLHGSGLNSSSFLILEGNIFGTTTGYSDVIDFTGGQRPGPILQAYNNIFLGGSDDGLDLDGTDAHIEGNVFMNFIQDAPRDSSANAIATGENGSDVAHLVIVRNYFFNNDHDLLLKERSSAIVEHNTFVGARIASIQFDEPERAGVVPGAGAALDGNIFWDMNRVFDYLFSQDGEPDPVVSVTRSILPAALHYLGAGNLDADPRLQLASPGRYVPGAGSPAIGAALWQYDMGADVPAAPWIFGAPPALTREPSAALEIGGPGITDYRYRVNGGAWSASTPLASAIVLTNLADGPYTVEVIARDSAGRWQAENEAASTSWTVASTLPRLVINEVLASNNTAVASGGDYPDLIELYNAGATTIDLAGMSITDNPARPTQFVFPAGVSLAPGQYYVLIADAISPAPGLEAGFKLNGEGDGVWLYDKPASGGGLIDSVVFGPQAADWPIGRVGHDGVWALNVPTLGAANVAAHLGDPARLKVNEILAAEQVRFDSDYVELFNADVYPVALAGLYLSDDPAGRPTLHQIAPLSFIAPSGFVAFVADDDITRPNHVGFKLDARQGIVALYDANLREIDRLLYYGQTTDYSHGRFPDGGASTEFFRLPTRGLANAPTETAQVTSLIALSDSWRYNQANINLGTAWREAAFNDAAWPQGAGVLGLETGALPVTIGTTLTIGPPTYYFRRHFNYTPAAAGVNQYLKLTTLLDDGAVIYVNGQEVARVGMPLGTIGFSTLAARNIEAYFEEPIYIPLALLQPGDNVIAVEVHQTSLSSTDVVFGLALEHVVDQPNGVYANEMAIFANLAITEMNFNPASGLQGEEYIELCNVGTTSLDLAGVRFTSGIDFTFPVLTLLPGQTTVVVKDAAAFAARYGSGIPVAGVYTGSLDNSGETVTVSLAAPLDAAAIRLQYDPAYKSAEGVSPGAIWERSLQRSEIFADVPGAWISQFSLANPSAYAFTWSDPRFVITDGNLYLKPGVELDAVLEPTVTLHIHAEPIARPGFGSAATYTLNVIAAPAPWEHAHQWLPLIYDVNVDGLITPLDALLIIIELNAFGPRELSKPLGGTAAPLFFDVSGDDAVSPLDALLIINFLNGMGGAGEAESLPTASQADDDPQGDSWADYGKLFDAQGEQDS